MATYLDEDLVNLFASETDDDDEPVDDEEDEETDALDPLADDTEE